jgi:hypothetical protein
MTMMKCFLQRWWVPFRELCDFVVVGVAATVGCRYRLSLLLPLLSSIRHLDLAGKQSRRIGWVGIKMAALSAMNPGFQISSINSEFFWCETPPELCQ